MAGYAGEVYGHGISIIWSIAGLVVGIMLAVHIFVPVIYPLHLDSVNEVFFFSSQSTYE
jgi:Na+/proline symporter